MIPTSPVPRRPRHHRRVLRDHRRVLRAAAVAPLAAVLSVGLAVSACGNGAQDEASVATAPTVTDTADGGTVGGATTGGVTTDGALTDGAEQGDATADATGDTAAGDAEPGSSGGSVAAVDDILGGAAAPLDHDPAAVVTATVAGGTFAAADVTGPVVYWFWAPWCTICRGEAPEVADVAAEFEGRVTFVGVAGLGPVEDMRRFVADTGVDGFTHAVDDDGSVWTGFGVFSQPSYVFVDGSGEARTWPGGLSGERLRAVAAALSG